MSDSEQENRKLAVNEFKISQHFNLQEQDEQLLLFLFNFIRLDEEVLEIVELFYKNKSELVKHTNPDKKIIIDNILDFKDHATAIVGLNLNEYFDYIINRYSLRNSRHTLKFEELYQILKPWALYQSRQKDKLQAMVLGGVDSRGGHDVSQPGFYAHSDDYISDYMRQNSSYDNTAGKTFMIDDQFYSADQEAISMEKEHYKQQSQSIIRFKLAKHEQKIEETLLENCSDEANKKINVAQLQRVFRDLAYLCGFIVVTFEDVLANDFIMDNDHKQLKHSSTKAIEEFIKFAWLQEHNKLLKKVNKRQSCLKKSGKEWPDVGPIKDAPSFSEKDDKIVFFEDDLYEKERAKLQIYYMDFKKLILNFIDQEDNSSVVVDINNDFSQIESYNQNDGKNLDYIFSNMPLVVSHNQDPDEFDFIKENLERTLRQYQRLYEVADFRTEKERQFMSDLIKQLSTQLDQHQVNVAQKKALNQVVVYKGVQSFNQIEPKSKYEKSLQEIFYFYSRQHRVFCITFQEMWDDSIHMRNGEFIMFCREFGIKIQRERAVAIFNKTSDFRKPISFKQFVQLLDLLAVTLNEIKIDQLEKRLKMIKKLLAQHQKKIDHIKGKQEKIEPIKQPIKESGQLDEDGNEEDESQKTVRFDSQVQVKLIQGGVSDPAQAKKELEEMQDRINKIQQQSVQLEIEKDKIINEVSRCKAKKVDQCNQELMQQLELDYPQKYRAKMKGCAANPFQMKDLSYRINKLPDDILRKRMKLKVKSNSTADELKKKVEMMKQERLKRQHEREHSQQQEFRDQEMKKKKLFGQLFSDAETTSKISRATAKRDPSKAAIDSLVGKNDKESIPEEEQIKKKPAHPIFITLNDLEKMNVKQFNRNIRADFQPEEFLYDTEEEDDKDKKKKKKANKQQHSELAEKLKAKVQQKNSSLENSFESQPPQPKRSEQKRGGHQIANQSELVAGLKTHRALGAGGPIKAQSLIENPSGNPVSKLKNAPLTSRNHPANNKSQNDSLDLGYQSQNEKKSKKLVASINPKKLQQQSLDLSNKPLQGSLKASKSQQQLQQIVQSSQQPQMALALISKDKNQQYKTDKMRERANEIEKTTEKKNVQSMKDILKMHDRQVNKGLKVANKKQ
ncbi:UNKNOWN [Stylonychia lemnae]|uniref:Uncharacterized protein n=1 Tax=Stylonychia lemnae TaxID=5949 RepID=A0A078AKR4_STYLE|nr:UNKNOWN [Stylonychia lemnae]|eukprot:CDW81378.1 UNKNOWN [Stylonychia lemnae]